MKFDHMLRGTYSAALARPASAFFLVAGALTAARIATLVAADANLGPDEAQYWAWSLEPASGYFSKPPLIAWTIALTTSLFGDAEWAVRLASPFFHLGSAAFLFFLAQRLYGAQAALFAGVTWITIPGVSFSSALITTDAPLLFFWTAALYCFFRLLTSDAAKTVSPGISTALGAAIGLGFLSKYAMSYFLIGAALAFVLSRAVRRRFKPADVLIAAIVALAVLAPNLLWNAAHDFQTIAHTAANAKWGPDRFHPGELGEFLASQLAVLGPILIGLFVWGAFTMRSRLKAGAHLASIELALFAYVLPPIAIVSAQAFISRAHANWAATAYPAALVLIVAWALRARLGPLLGASIAIHAVAAAAFMTIYADFALADRFGLSDIARRLRGWDAQGAEIRAAAAPYDAILVDDRELVASITYYARGGPPVLAWNSNQRIDSHFEAFMAYDPKAAPSALFVSLYPEPIALNGAFAQAEPLGEASVSFNGGERRLYLFAVSGYRGAP
jgi:4-amino-4-deoxy-L-arabinose transferase-like glycosyltransferase